MELGPNNTAAQGQGQALSDSHDFLCSSQHTPYPKRIIDILVHRLTEPTTGCVLLLSGSCYFINKY